MTGRIFDVQYILRRNLPKILCIYKQTQEHNFGTNTIEECGDTLDIEKDQMLN